MLSARSLLIRGMLVGLVAGLVAFGFASLFGEPAVDQAIAFESSSSNESSSEAAHSHGDEATDASSAEEEPVSRAVQSTIGLGTAVGVYGVALGGLFALLFAFAYGRVGKLGARTTAALLALGAFVTVNVVPFLIYPPNPPAVGSPDTIGRRTTLFVLVIVIAIGSALLAVYGGRHLAPKLGNWNAVLIAGGGFVVFLGLVSLVLPTVNEVPEGFPAGTLYQFRLASLGTQAVTWATLGLLFGGLTQRSLSGKGVKAPKPAKVDSVSATA